VTPRQADLLTGLGLVGLAAAIALSAPRWSGLLRSTPAASEPEEAAPAEATPALVEPSAAPARRISVKLYFEAADRDGLLPEEREVAFSSDLAEQLHTVVAELARGPLEGGLLPTLPAGTQVQEVFVQGQGVACVSLSPELVTGLPGGSRSELLTVYSIVDTVVANFPAISRVQLVVGDQPTTTLGGHVDLARPLPPDMTLVALPPPAQPAPATEPGS
jgi:spore germination protein GerM